MLFKEWDIQRTNDIISQATLLFFEKAKGVVTPPKDKQLRLSVHLQDDKMSFFAVHDETSDEIFCAGYLRVIDNEGQENEVVQITLGLDEPKLFYYSNKRDQVFMRRRGF